MPKGPSPRVDRPSQTDAGSVKTELSTFPNAEEPSYVHHPWCLPELMMGVAVVHTVGATLVLQDRPTPTPGPGQIVVRIEASGLCHTDIHASHGDWPVKPGLPFVGPSG